MKEYDNKEVTKLEKVLKSVKCDCCQVDITKTEIDFYYEVNTSHSRWGNDSIESFEYLDFCSWECLSKNTAKYFTHAENSHRYEIEQVGKKSTGII